jgi:hypothetical protein
MAIIEDPGKENATGKPDTRAVIINRTKIPKNRSSITECPRG